MLSIDPFHPIGGAVVKYPRLSFNILCELFIKLFYSREIMKFGICNGQNFTAPEHGELLCKAGNFTYAMDYIGTAQFDPGVGMSSYISTF